jgi:type I restriction enzyme, S subunit
MSTISFAPISEYCEIVAGFAFKSKDLANQGIPVIKIANITDDFRVEISSTQQYFPEEMFLKKHEKYILKNRDIIIAMTGAKVGKIGRIRNTSEAFTLLNQRVAKISCDNIDSDYLWAAIRNPGYNRMFSDLAIGAAQPNMSAKQIGSIEVPIFTKVEEKKIGQMSNFFDSMIAISSDSQNTCQQIVSTLFRSWFIDFDPGKANAEGRRPHGMDEETAILFPDSFEGSEKGLVPSGWKSIGISKISSCNDGDWIELKDQGGSDYRLVQPSNIGLGNFVETGNFRYITEETFQRLNCIQIEPLDVLVARMPDPKGNVGRAYIWPLNVSKAVTSVDVCIIRVDSNQVTPKYLELYLNSYESLARCKSFMTGTTHPRIRRKDIETYHILVPPISILKQFEKRVRVISDLNDLLVKQKLSLSATRDALLSRLMSGELSFS